MMSPYARAAWRLLIVLTILIGLVLPAHGGPQDWRLEQIDFSSWPSVVLHLPAPTPPPTGILEFQATENGVPVPVQVMSSPGTRVPITLMFVLDVSPSMTGEKLEALREAFLSCLDLMEPGDRAGLVSFDGHVREHIPPTDDLEALRQAGRALAIRGNGTAIGDGAMRGLEDLVGGDGLRHLVLLGDGMQNSGRHSPDDVIQQAQEAGLPITTIGLGDAGSGLDAGTLRRMAEATRGSFLLAPSPTDLERLFADLTRELQNRFRVAYTSPVPVRDGMRRQVEVTVTERVAGRAVRTTGSYQPGGLVPEVGSWSPSVLGFFGFLGAALALARRRHLG